MPADRSLLRGALVMLAIMIAPNLYAPLRSAQLWLESAPDEPLADQFERACARTEPSCAHLLGLMRAFGSLVELCLGVFNVFFSLVVILLAVASYASSLHYGAFWAAYAVICGLIEFEKARLHSHPRLDGELATEGEELPKRAYPV